MTDKMVFTRNLISGAVGHVPATYLDHPVFGKQLEVVPEGTKGYIPEMYKAKESAPKPKSEDKPSPAKAEPKPASEVKDALN